jgi:hypothetical protein
MLVSDPFLEPRIPLTARSRAIESSESHLTKIPDVYDAPVNRADARSVVQWCDVIEREGQRLRRRTAVQVIVHRLDDLIDGDLTVMIRIPGWTQRYGFRSEGDIHH